MQRFCNFICMDKKEKPEAATSGFKEELPQITGSSPQCLFSNTSSGCLQDRRPTYFTLTSNSMWLVSSNFFCLPVLLERTALLQ